MAQLIGACGEEAGWRAFLQPYLERRYSPVVSALIVGLAWGTWHVEYLGDGVLFVAAFLVLAVALSVILAVLVRGACGLAVAGTFHWLLNLGVLLLINFASGSMADVTALAAGFTVVAGLLLAANAARVPALAALASEANR